MKITKHEATGERQVVCACIYSRAVLAQIADLWKAGKNQFPSRWSNIIVGWCVAHYEKYRNSPRNNVLTYFDAWADKKQDADTLSLVESFVQSILDEAPAENTNPAYLCELARQLFETTRITDVMSRVAGHMEQGEIDRAGEVIEGTRKIMIGAEAWVGQESADTAMVEAYEQQSEVLIQYPDALGNFFGHALERDGFISIMAPEKTGKSQVLMDLIWTAAMQGRNVAHFEVGDMSRNQVLRRYGVRASGRPLRGDPDHPLKIPESIESPLGAGILPEVTYSDEWFPHDLDSTHASKRFRKVYRTGDRLRISCHPNSTISVRGIEAILDGWQRDGWAADVVGIDYADILAPIDGKADTRDQINATWKAMRSLSQRFHCLVLTATQTDADSYKAPLLRRGNFSEDKRKYGHVTGMIGLNQNSREKDAGLMRLNWICPRDMSFPEDKVVWVAGCFAICRPFLVSTF